MPSEAWLSVLQAGQLGAGAWLAALEHFGDASRIVSAAAGELATLGLHSETIDRLKAPDPARLDGFPIPRETHCTGLIRPFARGVRQKACKPGMRSLA